MQRKQITSRPSYLTAHKNYDELHALLGNLSGKLSDVSKNVDKEFLASYRVHMLSIQSEIKSLREDVDKGVQALKSDGNVAKLELEVNWFVEECTRLRLHYTTMENDCLQMQARFKAMVEQKTYMNEQLKAILKRNRVLEAEIEHALKYNQKLKTDNANEEKLWLENPNMEDPLTLTDGAQTSGNGPTMFGPVEEDPLPPDNFYHEQLRRQMQSSPLSTVNFVPTPNARTRGSRSGSKMGGSRGSSRSSQRSASPKSPHRNASISAAGLASTKLDMRAALDTFNGGFDDYAGGQVRSADLDEYFDDFPQQPTQSQKAPKQATQQVPVQEQPQQQTAQPGAATRRSSSGIPKAASVSTAAQRAQRKQRLLQQQQAKQQLIDFLKHKSPAEAALERTIADIFEEVRLRKVHAAKRGSIKRFGINFMGKDAGPGEAMDTTGMSRKRSGGAGANQSQGQEVSRSGGRASSPVMPGTALGRRLGMTAEMAAGNESEDQDPAEVAAAVAGELLLGRGGAAVGTDDVTLLRQPLIQATGGLSGLGVEQLSDNDKFSCMVKYLLDYDRFKEVVEKLQAGQQ